jgi:hypothetical protein
MLSAEPVRALPAKSSVVAASAALGAGYGAAFGALAMGFRNDDMLFGGLGGALLGLIGGGALGVVALPMGSRSGWCWAAILAGVILGGIAPSFAVSGQVIWDAPHSQTGPLWGLLTAVTPPVIAAALGLAVARGLNAGRSRVPGVQGVVNAIHAARVTAQSRDRSRATTEVLPAPAPAGHGDEPSPAGLPSAAGGETACLM